MPKPNIIDYRGQLPRNGAFPQRALSQIAILAVHYQGGDTDPNIPILDLLTQDANFHINKDWGGGAHGYGIEYHYACDDDGIYWLEDETAVTWNDTNANVITLAIVLPRCGPTTPPGPKSLANLQAWLDWVTTERPEIPAERGDVYGHGELTQYGNSTSCPGYDLLKWVQAYRDGAAHTDPPAPPPPVAPDVMVQWSKRSLDNAVTIASVIGEETYKPQPNLVQIQMWVQDLKHELGA